MSLDQYKTSNDEFIDDMTPRDVPRPTVNLVQDPVAPSVPEVTIMFDNQSTNCNRNPLPQKTTSCLEGIQRATDFATVNVANVNIKLPSSSSSLEVNGSERKDRTPGEILEQCTTKPRSKDPLERIEEDISRMFELFEVQKKNTDAFQKNMLSLYLNMSSSLRDAIMTQTEVFEMIVGQFTKSINILNSAIETKIKSNANSADKSIQCYFGHDCCNSIGQSSNSPNYPRMPGLETLRSRMPQQNKCNPCVKDLSHEQEEYCYQNDNHDETKTNIKLSTQKLCTSTASDRSFVMNELRKKYLPHCDKYNPYCKKCNPDVE